MSLRLCHFVEIAMLGCRPDKREVGGSNPPGPMIQRAPRDGAFCASGVCSQGRLRSRGNNDGNMDISAPENAAFLALVSARGDLEDAVDAVGSNQPADPT